jgi:hypothetical protein
MMIAAMSASSRSIYSGNARDKKLMFWIDKQARAAENPSIAKNCHVSSCDATHAWRIVGSEAINEAEIVNTIAHVGLSVSCQATMLAIAKIWHVASNGVYFFIPRRKPNTVTASVHRPVALANIAVCIAPPDNAAIAVIIFRSDHVNHVTTFGCVLFRSTSLMYGRAAITATTPDAKASTLCIIQSITEVIKRSLV